MKNENECNDPISGFCAGAGPERMALGDAVARSQKGGAAGGC